MASALVVAVVVALVVAAAAMAGAPVARPASATSSDETGGANETPATDADGSVQQRVAVVVPEAPSTVTTLEPPTTGPVTTVDDGRSNPTSPSGVLPVTGGGALLLGLVGAAMVAFGVALRRRAGRARSGAAPSADP